MFPKSPLGADVFVGAAPELAAVVAPAVAVVDAGVAAADLFRFPKRDDVPGVLLAGGAAVPPKSPLGCAPELEGVALVMAGWDELG
jgi:hypothetical protein